MNETAGKPGGGYAGETYYGRPAVKHSEWGWKVSAYIFLGGLSGAAQIIAAIAQRTRPRRSRALVRNARYIAAAGSAAGAVLLVADLHTPQRWYNMLRIFRRTSPMSIGTYILSAFGGFSGLAALGQFFGGSREGEGSRFARGVADAVQIPAAVAGAGMSTYTAALLASTSTPLWAAAPRELAAHFGCSAMASGAAALSLAAVLDGDAASTRRLDELAFLATLVDAMAVLSAESRRGALGTDSPRDDTMAGMLDRAGELGLGHLLPLGCYALHMLTGQRSRGLSVLASTAVLAGSLMSRMSIMQAGNRSADSPTDYFSLAQPQNLAAVESGPEPGRALRPAESAPQLGAPP